MAAPQLIAPLMAPEERAQYDVGTALRSLKRSHGKYRYRHLKSPTSEADISDDDLAELAFDYAEDAGGTSDEIVSTAKKYYDLLKTEQAKRSGRHGREALAAIKAGAAETPYTTMPTPEQAEAIPQGEWFLTEEQAKLKLVKSGAIPAEQVRHFMMGKYSPEAKKLLEETLATPQAGPPEKFEGGETTRIGRAVSTLFDVLGTGGRASAGGMAAGLKDLRESGRLGQIARGKDAPIFTSEGIGEAAKGIYKGAVKAEDAPNLEAELVRTREHLIDLAFNEAEKELPGFSGKDITAMAKYKYGQYMKNLGSPVEQALDNPSKAATAYEIVADPIMYVGGAPYKLGMAAAGKMIPKAAKTAMAGAAARVLGSVSYRAQFLPLEMAGKKGKQLAEGLRFAETNLGPGAKGVVDEVAEETMNLLRRVKDKDKDLFFSVVHKEKPIESLPEYLRGIVPDVKKLGDDIYNLKVKYGTGQTLIRPKAKYIDALKGTGQLGDKLSKELNYVQLNIGKEVAEKLHSGWSRVRDFASKNKLDKKDYMALLKYASTVKTELPESLAKNANIAKFAEVMREQIKNIRLSHGIKKVGPGKIVQEAAYRKDWGSPLMLTEKGPKAAGAARYFGPVTGSVKHRTGKGKYIRDVEKQFEYALEAESRVAAKAAAYAGIKKASSEMGAWTVYNPTKKISAEQKAQEAAAMFTKMNKEAIEFVPLKKELTKKVLQVTEGPGTLVKKGARIILPKESADAITRIAEIYKQEQSISAFGDLYNSVVRPLQNLWRVNATVLRSPQFLATNFVGAIGLGALALGIKAINPKLQWDALRVAKLAAFGGSSKALKTKIILESGETKTLGELMDIMREIGIIGQYGKRYAQEMPGTGLLGKLEQQYRRIPRGFRVQQLAAFGDEYQHAVAFLGALKGTSPKHLAEAADFTAKFAGNYNRLTKLERVYLKEVAGFYTWNRFILPHVTKQIFENPQRLAVWEKLKQGWEAYYGENRPFFEAGIPNWMKYQTAATAPSEWQPDNPHEMAMVALETPQNTLGALVGESAVPFMLGPGAAALTELITGVDLRSGRRRPDIEPYMPNTVELEGKVWNLAEKSLPFGEAVSNLGKLYWDWGNHGAAAEVWLKYRVARDWLNIDRIITGQKPLGIPVLTKTYAFQPLREAARKKRRALGD